MDETGERRDPTLTPRLQRVARWPRSLSFRVVALSTFWAIVALVVIATIISALFRQVSERGFESVLSAHLFNLIGSVGVSDEGRLSGTPNLGDLSFSRPMSGWYWAVEPISKELGPPLRSPSMPKPVPSPSTTDVPFNSDFQRTYETIGPGGNRLEVMESELLLGEGSRIARFRVMGNLSDLDAEISQFARRLYAYLAIFGIGMIAINAAVILLGLRPLGRVRSALSRIRAGTAQRLDGQFPTEIALLADETNALIDSNRRVLERSRTQVGNLAHSLKTPLAILMNEGRATGGERGRLIADNAAAMQQQVEHYLQRALVAAQRDNHAFRTPVNASLQRLVRVMQKLYRDLEFRARMPAHEIVFAGEREDLEDIVGNLLENAGKWAKSAIAVSAAGHAESGGRAGWLEIVVEDDGPGIPAERRKDALRRGGRLDETKPGSGLGLAIVADLVDVYGGEIALGPSDMGGLKVTLRLPAG
jgi:signal transduction histidine kinase